MSNIWNFTKNLSKKVTGSSDFFTISSKDEKAFNTISTDEKGRLTTIPKKSVSFGKVEVIEVESYKEYNQLDLSFENIDDGNGCMKRCGIYCNCKNF